VEKLSTHERESCPVELVCARWCLSAGCFWAADKQQRHTHKAAHLARRLSLCVVALFCAPQSACAGGALWSRAQNSAEHKWRAQFLAHKWGQIIHKHPKRRRHFCPPTSARRSQFRITATLTTLPPLDNSVTLNSARCTLLPPRLANNWPPVAPTGRLFHSLAPPDLLHEGPGKSGGWKLL